MTPPEDLGLLEIADEGYTRVWQELLGMKKKELDNALAFIELQKHSIHATEVNAINKCISEVKAARSTAPQEIHIYFNDLLDVLDGFLG